VELSSYTSLRQPQLIFHQVKIKPFFGDKRIVCADFFDLTKKHYTRLVHDKKTRIFVPLFCPMTFYNFLNFNFFWIMATLKEKFGKFELSKEQAKMVNGGRSWTCYSADGSVALGTRTTLASALNMCTAAQVSQETGFGGVGCSECRENVCPTHETF
jgi:hypothetical protein